MLTTRRMIPGVLTLMLAAGACFAEDAEPAKFYKLDFVVKEVEGTKTLNSRNYSTIVSNAAPTWSQIRAGSKIRVASSNTSYEYVDVGVNIDVKSVREVQSRLSFDINAEVSSVPEGSEQVKAIRQNKWSSTSIVPLKKATILFSSDNVDSKSLVQLEVTATPLP
jgi:hypothetical protein